MKTIYLYALLSLLAGNLYAQDEEPRLGWSYGAGLGLDLSQLLQINPKQGAGQNRLGFGGAFSSFAVQTRAAASWESSLLWQFGVQRLGSGVIAQGADATIPFQKAIDELRINSKYGFQYKPGSKLYWTINGSFLSQVTPTYQFPDVYAGNFVSDFIDSGEEPVSKLFSPATAQLSAGIDYKPDDRLSVFFSPLASKFIIVANDVIASRGIHGNPVSGQADENGIFPEFDNVDRQLGAQLQIGYKSPFSGERGSFVSNLNLYSNYLRNPENVDLDWVNALNYKLFKNFQVSLLLNLFYDDDVMVQITDYDFPNGVRGLGKRLSVTQQVLITYAITFGDEREEK